MKCARIDDKRSGWFIRYIAPSLKRTNLELLILYLNIMR